MKLIYVINANIPNVKAHGYQVMQTCAALARAGVEVELVVPRRLAAIKGSAFSYYNVPELFKITRLATLDLIPWGIPYAFTIQQFVFAGAVASYLRRLDTRGAVVYVRGDLGYLLPFLSARHFIWESHILPRKKSIAKRSLRQSDGVVVVTEHYKQDLMRVYGLPAARILVAPDGVDLQQFDVPVSKEEARKTLDLPLEKRIAIYTGSFKTLEQDKGIADILKALRVLKERGVNILFIAVGGSSGECNFYGAMAKDFGVASMTRLVPRVTLECLALYQKAADVLLMPFPKSAHYEYYMSPLKMFEYMASKRPIIASKLSSLLEVLNEQNAILIQPDAPVDLSEAIEHLPEDAAMRAERAFADVQKYSWDTRGEKIRAFITQVAP